ncbi:hypothetical protein E0D86_01170 [Pseudomonas sp. IC_126]|uniref:hypothetical protein n=1 Tax=Pseudomonas sp. IC_126 TaxID=2547400 RepID=UPI00103A0825|nr:hypothetical protein [Pseudomonas sp. IC_126]TCD23856.1 hypothetical protein E0D86_01170 [Pseudomonas sp. IC_126]
MDEQHPVENTPPRTSKVLWFIFTPALGALAYSFLYLTGAIYSDTILNLYGVASNLFPQSPTDYMFNAYSALLQSGLNWINVATDPEILILTFALAVLFVAEMALLNLIPKSKLAKKTSTFLEERRLIKVPLSITLI